MTKVSLLIEDDAELRKELNKVIKGHIRAMLKEDLSQMLLETVSKNAKLLTPEGLTQLLQNEVKRRVSLETNEEHWRDDGKKLQKMIRVEVHSLLDRMHQYTTEQIKTQLAAILHQGIDNQIEISIRAEVKRILGTMFKPDKEGG